MTTPKLVERSGLTAKRKDGSAMTEFCWDTSVEVEDRGDRLVAAMHLPGIRAKQLDVSVGENYLRVAGSREEAKRNVAEWGGLRRNEYWRESFQRLVKFPEEVVPERSTATLSHGALNIELPKPRRAPRRVGRAEHR